MPADSAHCPSFVATLCCHATELTLPQFFTLMKELQQAKASLDMMS